MKKLVTLLIAFALLGVFVPQRMPCRIIGCQPPPICDQVNGPFCGSKLPYLPMHR